MASQDDKNPFDDDNRKAWHFGSISRLETDNLLSQKRPGTFLVRDSRTCPGDSVLCVSENSKVSHYIITKKDQYHYIIGDQVFSSLPEILNFYRRHYLDTTVLLEPCPHQTAVDPLSVAPAPPLPNPALGNKGIDDRPPLNPAPSKPDDSSSDPAANFRPPAVQPLPNAVRYRVKYTFSSEDAEDLPAQKNEILTLVSKDEQEWWTMLNSRGQKGQFPVPWMEPITNENPPATEEYRSIRPGPAYGRAIQRRIPSAYDTTQLKFEKGDLVKIVKQNMSGYWEGELLKDGSQGFFPFTFIEPIPPEDVEKEIKNHGKQNGMDGSQQTNKY